MLLDFIRTKQQSVEPNGLVTIASAHVEPKWNEPMEEISYGIYNLILRGLAIKHRLVSSHSFIKNSSLSPALAVLTCRSISARLRH